MKVDIDTHDTQYIDAWQGSHGTAQQTQIDVRDLIQHNYTPYENSESFLADVTSTAIALWKQVMAGIHIENAIHASVDFDTNVVTSITAHATGYINQPLEKIVGLQTDQPLKRAPRLLDGINMIKSAFEAYDRETGPAFEYQFTALHKTHSQGVFDVCSLAMLRCRKSGMPTGLLDGYGRERITSDYRRVALYDIRYLTRERELQFADLQPALKHGEAPESTLRLRKELAEQQRVLQQMQEMATCYGCDTAHLTRTAREVVQWLYFVYLTAVKSQNDGVMSLGRTATFLNIYVERGLRAGRLNEQQAQELIDHFIMEIRIVCFLRTPEFDSLFSGDPIWVTEMLGGMGLDGHTLVSRTTFRYLHTLHTIGSVSEPNLTIL